MPYLVFHAIDVLELDRDGVLPGLFGGYIADSVGRQIGMAILIVGNLEFSGDAKAKLSVTALQEQMRKTMNLMARRVFHPQTAVLTPHTSPLHPERTVGSHPAGVTDGAQSSSPAA